MLAALSICALFVGAIPAACLSDAVVPPCVLQSDCAGGNSGQGVDAGDAGGHAQGLVAGSDEDPMPPVSGAGGSSVTVGDPGGSSPLGESGAAGVTEAGTAGSSCVCHTCAFSKTELPNPCGSDAYSTDISVSGGVGQYSWHVAPTTDSWDVEFSPSSGDHSRATLTGNPSGAVDLTLTVTDGAGCTKEQAYSLTPRSACYFAYVASDVNGPKLALRDPQLGTDATGKLTSNLHVYDFQFSPDGRFLAYRYGQDPTHPNGAHVSLLNLSTMQDQALAFAEDAVNTYAWSPDSTILAIAFTASDVSTLSGVRINSAASPTQVTALTPVIATDPIESNLFWVGSSFVSFFSATTPDLFVPPGVSSVFYASLKMAGFDAPVPIIDFSYEPGFVAVPAPGGLFVTSPKDNKSLYNAVGIDNAFAVDHQTNFVDPAGRFSAAIATKTLKLFQATNNLAPFENSGSDPLSNCPKLLTWAGGVERIACVANVVQAAASWGEIRIFDAGSASPFQIVPSIVKSACLKDEHGVPLAGQCSQSEYDYDETTSAAQPRLLSSSGKWLAFITGAQSSSNGALYWANLETKPMTITRQIGTPSTSAGSATVLAFSPSERYLLNQMGSELFVHRLSAGPNDNSDIEIEANLAAPSSPPCAEDFTTTSTRWCGGANGSPSFIWSPAAAFDELAYRKGDSLAVVELAEGTVSSPRVFSAPLCGTTCSGQYAFQPPKP